MTSNADMAEASARWRRIEDALSGSPERMAFVRQTLSAYEFAQAAYNAAYNGGPEQDGILLAGTLSASYIANFDYIRESLMGGAEPCDVLGRMQKASEWLERMDWHGMPRSAFVGMKEIQLHRTAAGVHDDMRRYRESAERFRSMACASDKEDGHVRR